MTLEEVAAVLGCRIQTLGIYETRGRGLGKHSIYKMADLFDVDPRYLEGYTPKNFSA